MTFHRVIDDAREADKTYLATVPTWTLGIGAAHRAESAHSHLPESMAQATSLSCPLGGGQPRPELCMRSGTLLVSRLIQGRHMHCCGPPQLLTAKTSFHSPTVATLGDSIWGLIRLTVQCERT